MGYYTQERSFLALGFGGFGVCGKNLLKLENLTLDQWCFQRKISISGEKRINFYSSPHWSNFILKKIIINCWMKIELEGQKESSQSWPESPTGRRKSSSSCLARAQPIRDCQDSANEKPPHFKLSASHGHIAEYSLPNFLFLSLKELSSPCYGDLHVAHQGCRHWIAILSWSGMNSFLLEQNLTACFRSTQS